MKHWKTNEEMGEGFQHNEEEHKKFEYNSLEVPEEHEKNLTRTLYLIRDVWSIKQVKELQERVSVWLEEHSEDDDCTVQSICERT